MAEKETDLGRKQKGRGPGPEEAPAKQTRTEPNQVDGGAVADDAPQLVLDTDLSDYPLRDPAEDPRWAVRTVKGWVWFTLFCLGFILVMMVLGQIYD